MSDLGLPPPEAGVPTGMPMPAPAPVSFNPGQLITEAAGVAEPVVTAVVPPLKALMPDAVGRAGVAATAAQQAVAGIPSIPDGTVQKAQDTLSAAQLVAQQGVADDLMNRARIAAAIEMHAQNVQNTGSVDPAGATVAAQADFGKVKNLVESGRVDPKSELGRLWRKFTTSPNATTDGEVSGLLDMVGKVTNAVEAFDDEGLSAGDVSVAAVDMLADGPAVALALANPADAAKVLQSVGGRLPDVSVGDGVEVHVLPDGSSAVVSAPPSATQTLRNLYPAIGQLWAPSKPRTVPDLRRLASRLDQTPAVTYEEWPAGAWDDLGGHPGLQGETVVTAIVPDGQVSRSIAALGDVRIPAGAGVLTRPGTPDPEDEDGEIPQESIRARRIVIGVADGDPATVAGELELLGGQDVVVYAPGAPPEGWAAVRESVFRDPTGALTVVRSADGDPSASHTVDAWVRPGEYASGLEDTRRTPPLREAKQLTPGTFQFGDVTVYAPGVTFEKADVTEARRDGRAPVGIGMVSVGGLPALVPVFDGDSEDGFEAYAKVSGRKLIVQAEPADLSPVVELGLVLGQAGVNPNRVVVEGASVRGLISGV